MNVMEKLCVVAMAFGLAAAQYGPIAGGQKHRTTTTTEVPESANEILPPSPYQPPPGYKPPGEQTGQQPQPYPTPGQPQQPQPYPTPGQPQQPQPYPTPGQPQQPQGSTYTPQASQPGSQGPAPQDQTGSPYGPQTGTQVKPTGLQGPQPYQPQSPGQQSQAGSPVSQPGSPQVPPSVSDYQNFKSPRPQGPKNPGQYWWANPQTSPFKPGAKSDAVANPQPYSGQQAPAACQLGPPNKPGYPPQPSQPVSVSQPIPIPPQTKPNAINPQNPFLQSSLQKPIRVTKPSPTYGLPGQPQQPFQPQQPGQPQPYQPQQPGQSGQPNPYQPQQPGQAGQPKPYQPQQPGQQPTRPQLYGPQQPSRPQPYGPQQPGQQPGQPEPYEPQQPGQPGQQKPSQPEQPGQQPGQPNPYQPEQPGQAGQPKPYQPQQPGQQPGQPQPYNPQQPGQPKPYQPQQPGQQPVQPEPYEPQQPGQPDQQKPSEPQQPGQQPTRPQLYGPQQPTRPQLYGPQQPSRPQPYGPQQPGQQPGQQPYQPQGSEQPQPYQPQEPGQPQPQQPEQPGQPKPYEPQQPDQPKPYEPQQPGQQPGQQPYQPQQPGQQTGQQPYQPQQPGQQPGQQPYQPQQPGQPGQPKPYQPQPFQPQPQPQSQPGYDTQSCSGNDLFCVPASFCYNGIVSQAAGNPTKRGPCSPGEVCCKTKKPILNVPGYLNLPTAKPNYATEYPTQKYTGPLNTTPPPECAAALKCVDIAYCTAEGVMSDTPVALTREQSENRVPLSECQDVNTGLIGKCCRDPNYKDPWPAGMMMPSGPMGFDDGQYHPDGQPTTAVNPYTIKKPVGVFNQQVTPFPAPRPGQTHSQAFPGKDDQSYPKPGAQTPQPGYQQSPYSPQTGQPTGQPTYEGQQPYETQPYQPEGQPQASTKPQGSPSSQYPYQTQPQTPGSPATPQQPQPTPQEPSVSPYQPSQTTYQPSITPYSRPEEKHTQQQPTPYKSTIPQPYSQQQPQLPSTPAQPQPNPYKPNEECGVRGSDGGPGGDVSGFGEFPWHALILSKSNNSALCSGVIIAPNAVVTAAHCIEGLEPEDLQIEAGRYSLGSTTGPRQPQSRPIGAAAIHPSYDSGSLVKDEAVLVTSEPLVFDQHINKVCLAPSGTEDYQPSGGHCYVTGFGRPQLHDNAPGTPLHKVEVELIPKEQCESRLKKTHLGKFFILNKGFSCAVTPAEEALCKVDVGSPLVCERSDGHFELAGVYSWDTKCSSELPGITATCDTDWITQVLATPIEQLREQYKRPKFHATLVITDISSKPGFALGYGK